MFFFPKSAKEDTSTSASSTGKPPPLRRHDTFGSVELFEAWAKDSFINQSTVDILVNTHEIDCLPAVLALKKEDFPHLNLPVGQRRLLEEAVEKLRQDYELVQPPTPKAKISLEMPKYKSMLEIGELAEEHSGNGGSIGDTQPEVPSRPRAQSGYSSQRKSGQRKSKVELGIDEKESRPEKEALLVTAQSKTTSQMSSKAGQRTKKG